MMFGMTSTPELTLDPPGTGSAYPPDVESLMPRARQMAGDSGEVPSRNRLMKELQIGAPKATAVRDRLRAESPNLPVSAGAPYFDPNIKVNGFGHPGTDKGLGKPRSWPLFLLALSPFVAIWSGWIGLGSLTGFGVVHPFPGLPGAIGEFRLDTTITLPIGLEAYAFYAIRVWLSPVVSERARAFARASVLVSLTLGAGGQIAYHLMTAAHMTAAPTWLTAAVACVPILAAGLGFFLGHLVHTDETQS
jgi:hypothetical protein